jgi:hypothetical protein
MGERFIDVVLSIRGSQDMTADRNVSSTLDWLRSVGSGALATGMMTTGLRAPLRKWTILSSVQ